MIHHFSFCCLNLSDSFLCLLVPPPEPKTQLLGDHASEIPASAPDEDYQTLGPLDKECAAFYSSVPVAHSLARSRKYLKSYSAGDEELNIPICSSMIMKVLILQGGIVGDGRVEGKGLKEAICGHQRFKHQLQDMHISVSSLVKWYNPWVLISFLIHTVSMPHIGDPF